MDGMRLCFLLFCLFLPSVSTVNTLNNTDDLRNCDYARIMPRHGRQLLFWFALRVDFDQNNNMVLNFHPSEGHCGFHRFYNTERILPQPQYMQRYYEVGNLNTGRYQRPSALPEYVSRLYRNTDEPERNMDRLIISVNENNSRSVSRVFITAHYRNSMEFNPADTYEITPDLIREIRQTYYCSANSEAVRCEQFLRRTDYANNKNYCRRRHRGKRSFFSQCDAFEGMKLQIKTTKEGYAKLLWKNIPADILEKNEYVYIDICQNTYSSDEEDPMCMKSFQINELSGALDTSVSINAGLQPRLRSPAVMWYGEEFDRANRALSIRIGWYFASLQLFAKDGRACARLYIKKTFTDWKKDFFYSWVGFYKSSQDKNDNYYTYQYVVNFNKIDTFTEDYDIYEYESSLIIAPGVQIRFLRGKGYDIARTEPWECDGNPTTSPPTCNEGTENLSLDKFYYEHKFCDANNVAPVKIEYHNAGLQLFSKNGKACARLYIKSFFTNWKEEFKNSWVGFYTSSYNANDNYYTYQYAVYFEKLDDVTGDFDVYQYESSLNIAPGVQIRFLKYNGYGYTPGKTEPWTE